MILADGEAEDGSRYLSTDLVGRPFRNPHAGAKVASNPLEEMGLGYRYGFCCWMDAEAAPAEAEVISSPGFNGFVPFLDRANGYAAVLALLGLEGRTASWMPRFGPSACTSRTHSSHTSRGWSGTTHDHPFFLPPQHKETLLVRLGFRTFPQHKSLLRTGSGQAIEIDRIEGPRLRRKEGRKEGTGDKAVKEHFRSAALKIRLLALSFLFCEKRKKLCLTRTD